VTSTTVRAHNRMQSNDSNLYKLRNSSQQSCSSQTHINFIQTKTDYEFEQITYIKLTLINNKPKTKFS